MAIAETIVARADPYTIVLIPGIRIPSYVPGGVPLSVGQLARVEYAEVIPGSLRISPMLSFETSMQVAAFYVVSGSGNIITVKAFGPTSGALGTLGREITSWMLSSVPLYLKAYGR